MFASRDLCAPARVAQEWTLVQTGLSSSQLVWVFLAAMVVPGEQIAVAASDSFWSFGFVIFRWDLRLEDN